MTVASPLQSSTPRAARRYVREPSPLFFPVEETVPESRWHLKLRMALLECLEQEFRGTVLLSSDQFLYWDPTDPRRCLAPDLAARRNTPDERNLKSWKTWERGAPHVGVEILSDSDASELRLEEKLARYRQAGVAEVVAFDREDALRPIRIWDLVEGDLVERELPDPEALFCDGLELYWCAVRLSGSELTLRLARDAGGSELLPTPLDLAETERQAKEAALARVAGLEAELRGKR